MTQELNAYAMILLVSSCLHQRIVQCK